MLCMARCVWLLPIWRSKSWTPTVINSFPRYATISIRNYASSVFTWWTSISAISVMPPIISSTSVKKLKVKPWTKHRPISKNRKNSVPSRLPIRFANVKRLLPKHAKIRISLLQRQRNNRKYQLPMPIKNVLPRLPLPMPRKSRR